MHIETVYALSLQSYMHLPFGWPTKDEWKPTKIFNYKNTLLNIHVYAYKNYLEKIRAVMTVQ